MDVIKYMNTQKFYTNWHFTSSIKTVNAVVISDIGH